VYASAGHNPTLLYRARERRVETTRTRGIPLGAIRGGAIRATLQDTRMALEPGDFLLQYTDGLNEAFDRAEREQFGFERMAATLSDAAPRGASAVIETLLAQVKEWTGEGTVLDDQTVLAIHCVGAPLEQGARGALEPRDRAALEELSEARGRGIRLDVTGGQDLLGTIRSWVGTTPSFRVLSRPDQELLVTALYEVCANIAEHGYGNDPRAEFEVWWIPGAAHKARFLVRDSGASFHANDWHGKDLNDSAVRRRGRGLGLEIIHRAMRDVRYHPQTPEGNLTLMTFVGHHASSEEARHVR